MNVDIIHSSREEMKLKSLGALLIVAGRFQVQVVGRRVVMSRFIAEIV